MFWPVALVSGGILALLLVPLLGQRSAWDLNETPDRLRNIRRAKDRVMRTLKDLENDVREGSLAKDDYEDLRGGYKQEAIELTRELSRVREVVVRQIQDGPPKPLTEKERLTLEAMISKRVKKYRD